MGREARAKVLRFKEREGVMREIDVRDYPVKSMKDGELVNDNYEVKKSLGFILFHPNQQIPAREAITRDAIAKKIEAAVDNVLLEEAEWEKLKASVENLKYVGRNDIELVNRVLEAPTVDIAKRVEEQIAEQKTTAEILGVEK